MCPPRLRSQEHLHVALAPETVSTDEAQSRSKSGQLGVTAAGTGVTGSGGTDGSNSVSREVRDVAIHYYYRAIPPSNLPVRTRGVIDSSAPLPPPARALCVCICHRLVHFSQAAPYFFQHSMYRVAPGIVRPVELPGRVPVSSNRLHFACYTLLSRAGRETSGRHLSLCLYLSVLLFLFMIVSARAQTVCFPPSSLHPFSRAPMQSRYVWISVSEAIKPQDLPITPVPPTEPGVPIKKWGLGAYPVTTDLLDSFGYSVSEGILSRMFAWFFQRRQFFQHQDSPEKLHRTLVGIRVWEKGAISSRSFRAMVQQDLDKPLWEAWIPCKGDVDAKISDYLTTNTAVAPSS